MLIDNQTRDLVAALDEAGEIGSESGKKTDSQIQKLITHLRESCQRPENIQKYSNYTSTPGELGSYPVGEDGYAQAINPLTHEKDFYDCWQQNGVIVSPNIVSAQTRDSTVQRINELMKSLSDGKCDLNKPETYHEIPLDKDGNPALSRGFFEIYHDDSLAQLRQAIHAYIHHVVIWGTTDLWTTFDRFGVKLPGHKESKGLPLHVDQNPITNPNFNSLQGVLALVDCPTERGTLLVVPGSKKHFKEYAKMQKKRGEYVELDTSDKLAEELAKFAQPIPLRARSLVSWDSRTTHANTQNISGDTRFIAYLAAGPAKKERADLLLAREEALSTGLARYNHEALLRVTTKPRYTAPELITQIRKPEQLDLLGELLYGKRSY